MNDFEIKPCPFCGHRAHLEHSRLQASNNDYADFQTCWKVRCHNCGVEKSGGFTNYRFTNNETLEITDKNFDGRKNAIFNWNKRANNEQMKGGE